MNSKELLTASRLGSLLRCARQHYWRYEVGLQKTQKSDALRFGTAWHTAMETRAKGATIDDAFAAALGERETLDELQVAILGSLLAGYYKHYENDTLVAKVYPEVLFENPLHGSRTFNAAGKLDGLGELTDGRLALLEHKTASDSLADDSDYWIRLKGNLQVHQYVLAARDLGWNVETVIYDVVHKPAMRPKQIPILDTDGLKIVNDEQGNRVYNKDGKSPRQSAGEGMTMVTRTETADEFGDRLVADVLERPEFYFARKEIPVLEDDLDEFQAQRLVQSRQILNCRHQAKAQAKPHQGWPRHVNTAICRMCEFAGFCLHGITPDLNALPDGYKLGELHSELVNESSGTDTNE